jgi:RNA polymerase sigma-70 factor (ECF subfamily)
MDDAAIAGAISAWLRKQPPRQRVAFVRRYWYADSVTQVAKRLGLSEGGTKSLLHRQRQSLRAYLEQEGIAL